MMVSGLGHKKRRDRRHAVGETRRKVFRVWPWNGPRMPIR